MRHALEATGFTVIGRGIGFLIPIVIAHQFGATAQTDAFFFVYGLVFFLTGVFSNAIESAIVPFGVDIWSGASRQRRAAEFLGAVLLQASLTAGALTLVLLAVSWPLLPVVTRLADPVLAYRLLLEISPLVVFVTISSVLNGMLNAQRRFWYPAASPGVRGAFVLLGIWTLRDQWGIHALAVSYVVAELVRTIGSLVVLSRAPGVVPSLRRDRSATSSFGRLVGLLSAGTMMSGLMPLVDRSVASFLGPGSVSLLDYARIVFFVPVTLLSSGFLVVLLTRNAELETHRSEDARRVFTARLRILLVLATAAAVVGWQLRHVITDTLYGQRLASDELSTVSQTLGYLMLGLPSYVAAAYWAQAFIVRRSVGWLLSWTAVGLVALMLLDGLLARSLGLPGIAIANAVASTLVALGLYRGLDRLWRSEPLPVGAIRHSGSGAG